MRIGSETVLRALLAVVVTLSAGAPSAAVFADAFRMPVLDVFKITGKGVVLTGKVASGVVEVGDWVCVPMQGGQTVGRQVTGLEMFRKLLERAEAGENVGVLIDELDHKKVEKNADLVAGCAGDDAPSDESSDRGGVLGVIDGREFHWDVADPDSDSCGVFGKTFRVSYMSSTNGSTILMSTAVVKIEQPDGNGYLAVRDPLNSSVFQNAISVDGKTVTYAGKMQYGPLRRSPGAEVSEVDARISVTCP